MEILHTWVRVSVLSITYVTTFVKNFGIDWSIGFGEYNEIMIINNSLSAIEILT
jgi:hypothetical protein